MRLFILSLCAAVAAIPAGAAAQSSAPAFRNAEACLRNNVVAAVEASAGAADAAALLTEYLCAREIAAAALHQRNTATLENMRAMAGGMTIEGEGEMDDSLDDLAVDPVTGEIVSKAAKSDAEAQNTFMAMQMLGAMGMFSGGANSDPIPTSLRALAGQLVMEARRR